MTKTYDVKIEVNLWYDRNFTIEADSKLEAEKKAHEEAREQLKHLEDVDIEVTNDGAWSYGNQECVTQHVILER
jgi:hypothetical protein